MGPAGKYSWPPRGKGDSIGHRSEGVGRIDVAKNVPTSAAEVHRGNLDPGSSETREGVGSRAECFAISGAIGDANYCTKVALSMLTNLVDFVLELINNIW